jgi:hypothetical protein
VGSGDNFLTGVVALAANNVWAVGYSTIPNMHTLTMHWDGTQWSIVPSPNPNPDGWNRLYGVDAISPTDVWAVGETALTGAQDALTMHWDGVEWVVVPTPDLDISTLYGVSALDSGDVWAVGYMFVDLARSYLTIVLHWNGWAWFSYEAPNPTAWGANNRLFAVQAFATRDVWIAGFYTVSVNAEKDSFWPTGTTLGGR